MFNWLSDASSHPGWPATVGPVRLEAGTVYLRPVKSGDSSVWSELRISNQNELLPWEPTGKGQWERRHHPSAWGPLFGLLKREAKYGSMLPFVIELDGRYVGQLTIGNVQRGAVLSAWIGYWVDRAVAGRGIASAAVALGVDHSFGPVGLHRLEATVQPDNHASKAVLRRIGFREEGLLKRYMDVNARWRDHLLFGLTTEEISGSCVDTLIRSGRARSS